MVHLIEYFTSRDISSIADMQLFVIPLLEFSKQDSWTNGVRPPSCGATRVCGGSIRLINQILAAFSTQLVAINWFVHRE